MRNIYNNIVNRNSNISINKFTHKYKKYYTNADCKRKGSVKSKQLHGNEKKIKRWKTSYQHTHTKNFGTSRIEQ